MRGCIVRITLDEWLAGVSGWSGRQVGGGERARTLSMSGSQLAALRNHARAQPSSHAARAPTNFYGMLPENRRANAEQISERTRSVRPGFLTKV